MGLVLLSVVPMIAGTARLVDLAGGVATTDSARFFADPLPLVVHIVSATLFSVVGAFQFSPGLRRRHRGWHRSAGRFLVPLGLAAALSGLWLTLAYPSAEPDGAILYGIRLVVGSAMAACIAMSVLALRRRDYPNHGAWMARGYALGLGAGTQVLTHLVWLLLGGSFTEASRALVMAGGWAINLAVVEATLWRRRAHLGAPTLESAVPPLRTGRAVRRVRGERKTP